MTPPDKSRAPEVHFPELDQLIPDQPNESGADVRCPKCGSVETRRRIGSSVWDCACGVLFVPIKESMGKAALEEGCESVECGPPPAQSEAAEGKEAKLCSFCDFYVTEHGEWCPVPLRERIATLERERKLYRETKASIVREVEQLQARLFAKDVELTRLRADVLRLEKEKFEVQKELEVEIELRKEIGARLNLKCADLAAARKELEGAKDQVDHFQAHYESALFNWNEVITERDALKSRLEQICKLAMAMLALKPHVAVAYVQNSAREIARLAQ